MRVQPIIRFILPLVLVAAPAFAQDMHSADQDSDTAISLSELLRVIQFFNSGGLHCDPQAASEDGYMPGAPGDTGCVPHSSDYADQDWEITLSELLRLIQFFNTGAYHACPDDATEDGFCPGVEGGGTEGETTTEQFMLTVTSGSGSGQYEPGVAVLVTANTSGPDQVFDGWTGDTGFMANADAATTTITMPAQDVSIVATYASIPSGSVLVVHNGSGDGVYPAGSVISIAAGDPPLGMVFDHWDGDTGAVANADAASTTVTIPATNVTLHAAYRSTLYDLFVFKGSGDGGYNFGERVAISADAADAEQEFDRWTGDIIFLDDPFAADTMATMPAADIRVTATYSATGLRVPENPAHVTQGLRYDYFHGDFEQVPNFDELTPEYSGRVHNFDITERDRNDYFAFQYRGYVDIPVAGEYTFYTWSDDGSVLYIGDTLVVDNDYSHGVRERSGEIQLKSGKHAIYVGFFNRAYFQDLAVYWEGPGIAKGTIPDTALFGLEEAAHVLTVNSGTGSGVYIESDIATISANTAPEGQVFDSWTGDTANVIDPQSPATVLAMPAQDVTLTATYTSAPATTYTLTVNNGAGGNRYTAGTNVLILADEPLPGFLFDGWSGETAYVADPNSTATTVAMPAQDITVTAVYREDRDGPIVTFASHTHGGYADQKGFTLVGNASGPRPVAELYATVDVPGLGRTVDQAWLDVSTNSGQWAIRIWADEVAPDELATVTITGFDSEGYRSDTSINLQVTALSDHHLRVINRCTFGPTPELIDEVLTLGTDAWLEQQLDPESIDDSAFEAYMVDFEVDGKSELREYLLRNAMYSRRQLQQVMTWFWDNHFNTDVNKHGRSDLEHIEHERFREHAFGKFRDLLDVSAHGPTMLIYLDNYYNNKWLPNENYARELMELHTMGVDGGYTQHDVVELARILTGWRSYEDLFFFNVPDHDYEDKVFLGNAIPGTGADEGDIALDILAAHPSTANFISKKLIQLFVSDTPPQSLLDACAATFLATEGDIEQVLRTIFASDEFRTAPENYRNKVKSPLEHVTGLARAFDLVPDYRQLTDESRNEGMELFTNSVPTGWPEAGSEWISASYLHTRLRFVNYVAQFRRTWDSFIDIQAFVHRNDLEAPEAIVTFIFDLTQPNDFSPAGYYQALEVLNENGVYQIDGTTCDPDLTIRRMLGFVLSLPGYQYN